MQESEKHHLLNDSERQQVNDALEDVLATEKFEAAPQMSAFLRYVVEQAADGNQNRIKAFTVAVDALGKPDSFDPQNDPVVRVLAGRLRAALAAYNEENSDAPVIITMTPGSYVPSFQHRTATQRPPPEASQESADTQLHSNEKPQSYDGKLRGMADENGMRIGGTENVSIQRAPQGNSAVAGYNTDGERQKLADHIPIESRASSDANQSAGVLIGRLGQLFPIWKWAVACLVAGVALAGILQTTRHSESEPPVMAAKPASDTELPLSTSRTRPEKPAVFVSAVNQGTAFENTLHTVMSSVISESDQVVVYRILETESNIRFWPEDYILTLTALNLPGEKRVDIQLMEADSGRIIHSQSVSLNDQADDQLTQPELTRLIDAAQSIVFENGPLVKHFVSRQQER